MNEKISLEVDALNAMGLWPALPTFLVSTIDGADRPNVAPLSIVMFASYTNIGPMDESIGPSTVCPKVIIIALGGGLGRSFYKKKAKRTFKNIVESKQFVVNIPSSRLLKEINFCGSVISDKVSDTKFNLSGLTPIPSAKVRPPSVKECAIHYECELMKVDDFGGQMDLLWGKVVAARVDKVMLETRGVQRMRLLSPIYHYASSTDGGTFFSLGEEIGEEIDDVISQHAS